MNDHSNAGLRILLKGTSIPMPSISSSETKKRATTGAPDQPVSPIFTKVYSKSSAGKSLMIPEKRKTPDKTKSRKCRKRVDVFIKKKAVV